MYQAELRGKLSGNNEEKEDILTSNVFSFFKYSNRGLFLSRFLRLLKIKVTPEEAEKAEFEFWPQYDDHTEPDIVMTIGRYYLLFEAKLLSGFGKETEIIESQIKRELKQGLMEALNQDKEFLFITITANYVHPKSILVEAPKKYHKYCKWINWQNVARLINSILINEAVRLTPWEWEFANDLYQLLIKKKLGTYNGLSAIDQDLITFKQATIFFHEGETVSLNAYFDFSNILISPEICIQNIRGVFFARKRFSDLQKCGMSEHNTHIFYKGNQNGKRNHN
jgi:hypothetical protein